MSEETSYDYMISYAWADRDWVDGHLRPRLEGTPLTVHPAGPWPLGVPSPPEQEAFRTAMQASFGVLLVLTPAYLARGYRQFADLLAQVYGPEVDHWPVLPIVLRPVRLPPELSERRTMDANDPSLIDQLVAASLYGAPPPEPEPEPPPKDVSKETEKPGEPAPRYANVNLVDGETGALCPVARPLAVQTAYRLRIDIGPLRRESAVTNAKEFPVPAHLLPKTEKGHWLDVVVTSEQFTIQRQHSLLYLPNSGPSWVCGCGRDGKHQCAAPAEFLFVPLTSPATPGEASLRIGLYYENNLVQSQLLTARVGVEVPAGEMGYRAVIDFSLTQALTHVARLPPRTLNIMINDNGDGSHRFVLVNKQEVLHDTLEAGTLDEAMAAARKGLRDTHRELLVEADVEDLPDGTQRVKSGPKYGDNKLRTLGTVKQAKNKREFEEDLKRLAGLGWWLHGMLFERFRPSRLALRELLKEQATIQTCRAKDGGSPMLFPWALVYDIYLDSDVRKHEICPVLDGWKPGTPLADPEATRCPHDDGLNHRKNLICPFGFWGIKHIIEQPPPMPPGRDLALAIRLAGAEVNMAVGLSLDLARPRDHVDRLREELPPQVQIVDEDSKGKILEMLGATGLELLYFFCHGRRLRLRPGGGPIPFLAVGKGEPLTTGDITLWQDETWPEDHWQETKPLVFINGCHTAELTPDAMVSFVDKFIDAEASGVIGTEVTVEQSFAAEAALQLFKQLLKQDDKGQYQNVGQAMRRMRLEFLSRGNLMGLAYTPYCSASLRLE